MCMISGTGIRFAYEADGRLKRVLRDLDIQIQRGEFAVVLGANGSGKSTLVKHFNALLPLQKGELTVAGINAAGRSDIWRLRRVCGMVFQNPDNQFVSSVVEEDVAFGLENYEVPREQIPDRVRKALRLVGMEGYENRSPHSLSGGQKQRVALAGVLALEPDIVILDEVTAMLDPQGRQEVLESVRRLHEQEKKTVVMITHYIEEAVLADRVFLLGDGVLQACGTPREILTDPQLLDNAGLTPPLPVKIYYDLYKTGIRLDRIPLTNEELVEELCQLN